jgi:hypothetical protein
MSLDPKTNRREREAEKAKKAAEEPPLNPLFPHKRQAFDPFFFLLEQQPIGEEAEAKTPAISPSVR